MHQSDAEIARIRSAYKSYLENPETISRWTADSSYKRCASDERLKVTDELLTTCGLAISRSEILEVGCWTGGTLDELQRLGASASRLHAVDLMEEAVAEARKRLPHSDIRSGNAETLPYAEGTMDLVVQSTAFSSILDQELAVRIAKEMLRVLTSTGAILWYDLRQPNPWNQNVRAYTRREIRSLFPGMQMTARTLTLNPKIGHYWPTMSPTTYRLLSSLPATQSHSMAVLTRRPIGSNG
jgi:ubiquinone/menaquinone biosynthesis C-methylase UbiE